ncbi:Flagellar hook-length control protein FliK [Sandaracinus amylolyticus]|uniref:Flagellar hook-length control protein FliK n=1 Tax=Sandaracinus amylolyticus TaxID=927083 RepID=A0A0F6SDV1_9BACT|nr:Flagellar hook-length control protein FliK [Sandaracinus amylolyticus]
MAGVCLVAAACGGEGSETSRADLEEETIGGEAVATGETRRSLEDEYSAAQSDAYGVDPAVTRDMSTSGTGASGSIGAEGMGAGAGVSGSIDEGGLQAGATGGSGMTGDMGATGSVGPEGATGSMQGPGMAQAGATGTMQEPEPGMEEPGMAEPMAQQANVCPADIEGLNVRVSTIPRGGALVFTTRSEENVTELRDRLNRFADMHRRHHEQMQPGATGAVGAGAGTTTQPGASAQADIGAGGTGGSVSGSAGTTGAGVTGSAGTGAHEGHSGMTAQAGATEEQFADPSALIHQASEVRVVEIPRGARLEVRFDDTTQVRELRTELREDATMLREGRCPLALQIEST